MHELIGIVLGVAVGSAVSSIRPRRLRAAAVLPALFAAGVLTSAVNGELGTGLAGIFVAVDTLLAGLGFVLGTVLAAPRAYLIGARGLHPPGQESDRAREA
jgi:hypothetical protein